MHTFFWRHPVYEGNLVLSLFLRDLITKLETFHYVFIILWNLSNNHYLRKNSSYDFSSSNLTGLLIEFATEEIG